MVLINLAGAPQTGRESYFPFLEKITQNVRLPFRCASNCRRNNCGRTILSDCDVKSIIFPALSIYPRSNCYACGPKCADNPIGMAGPNCRLFDCHLNARRHLLLSYLCLRVINVHVESGALEHVRDLAFITNRFLVGRSRRHRDMSHYRILQAARDFFSLL